MCYPPRDEARAKRRRKARATRVALNYGCRRKCSGERAWTHGRWRVGSGGRKLFPSRRERGGDSTTREARKVSRAFRERRKKGGDQTPRAPRMLSSDRRASNYSSAHLTRMNVNVKVSSSASRRLPREGVESGRREGASGVGRASGPSLNPSALGPLEQT